jgi:hypothetical protein
MGAGNPKLRSFDDDKFEPTTYFIDLSQSFEETREYLQDATGEEPSEDVVYTEINSMLEITYDDFIESLCSEAKLTRHRDNLHSELSCAFRQDGIILAEGESVFAITETGSELSHMPFALIPNFKFETLVEEAESQMWDKQDWYEARGKDWDAAVRKIADKNWNIKMREFVLESNRILKMVHLWYGNKMRYRCGAWMSSQILESDLLTP